MRVDMIKMKRKKLKMKKIEDEKRLKLISINRIAEPKEISDYIESLVTESNSYVTGQTLTVSGGE
jgi:NAD(P)-dependent dehydrogenase (short-subunit alcohol dehydrogenase family)